jgi:hypothetical protein
MKTNDEMSLINPKVWDKFQRADVNYKRFKAMEAGMKDVEETIKKFKQSTINDYPNAWTLQLFINGAGHFNTSSEGILYEQTQKIIEQFLTLLESVYYAEMMDAVKQLNKTLED